MNRPTLWKMALLLVVFLALTAWGWSLLVRGTDGWVPFMAWTLSLAAAWVLAGIADGEGTGARYPEGGWRLRRTDWILLGLVTLLAAAFRLYRIDSLPNGFWIDEIWTVSNAIDLVDVGPFAPFATTPLSPTDPAMDRQCNLYLYFVWIVHALFGSGQIGTKMVSVLPGIAAVPLLYLLARAFLGRAASFSAAGLLAVSIWHVTLSRWGWAEVLSTALVVAAAGAVLRGIRTGSARFFLSGGMLSGISLYTYLSSRLGAAILIAFLVLRLVVKRDGRHLRSLALYLLGLLLAAFPLFVAWHGDPDFFLGRMNSVSIMDDVFAGKLEPLRENTAAHLLMFHGAGDRNPRHNLPGEPMLDRVSGALFLAGLLAALVTIRKTGSQLCLLWLAIGLLGGILSNPIEAPQAYRTGLVAPACFLIAATAIEALRGFLRRRQAFAGSALSLTVLLLIVLSAFACYDRYFVARPASKAAWYASWGGPARFVCDRVEESVERGETVFIDRAFRNFIFEFELAMRFGNQRPNREKVKFQWAAIRRAGQDLSFLRRTEGRAVLFVQPKNFNKLRQRLAGASPKRIENRFGDVLAVIVTGNP